MEWNTSGDLMFLFSYSCLVEGFCCAWGWRKKSEKWDEALEGKMGAGSVCYLAGLRQGEPV